MPEDEEDNNAIPKNIIPSFNTIKPSIYRLLNKNIPKDIEDLTELPEDSPIIIQKEGTNLWHTNLKK